MTDRFRFRQSSRRRIRPTRSRRASVQALNGLHYEHFEARKMLSATSGELEPAVEQRILEYVANADATAYLQQGGSDLEFVAMDATVEQTTTIFQQTINDIPIDNAYITIVQDADGSFQGVYDRGFEVFVPSESVEASVSFESAQQIVSQSLARAQFSNGQLVWYFNGHDAELAWEVNSYFDVAEADKTAADFVTTVDATTGQILNQQTPDNIVADLLVDPGPETGIYPRIVINDAIGPAGSRAYAAPFDAVVELSVGCTGTLIASNTVLTARHCGASAGDQVRFGDNGNGASFTVASRFLPDGNGSLLDGGDVSILTLTSNVPSNIATPMRLIEETNALQGEIAATLGYGFNGVGSQGHQFTADGFRWGGENVIDRYGSPVGAGGSNIFSTDFDNGSNGANTIGGSNPTPLEFEATTAPGDSGGPLLVQVGSEWVIAGVLSGGTTSTSVYGDISWWTGIAPYRAAIEARGGEFVGNGINVTPESANIVRGVQVGGNLGSLANSDDNYLEVLPATVRSLTQPPVQIEVTGTSSIPNPNELQFRFEAHANTVNLTQIVEVYNFALDQYQFVDVSEASFVTDSVVEVSLPGSATQFVEAGTGEVRARLSWSPSGLVLFNPWRVSVDEVTWLVDGGGESPSPIQGGDADDGRSIGNGLDLASLVTTSVVDVRGAQGIDLGVTQAAQTPLKRTAPIAVLNEQRIFHQRLTTDRLFADASQDDLENLFDEVESEQQELQLKPLQKLNTLPTKRVLFRKS